MLDKEQWILNKIAGEASEVAHIALKAQEFGLMEVYPKAGITNIERLFRELSDLTAAFSVLAEYLEELGEDGCLDHLDLDELIEKKVEKMEKYRQYSVSRGRVDGWEK